LTLALRKGNLQHRRSDSCLSNPNKQRRSGWSDGDEGSHARVLEQIDSDPLADLKISVPARDLRIATTDECRIVRRSGPASHPVTIYVIECFLLPAQPSRAYRRRKMSSLVDIDMLAPLQLMTADDRLPRLTEGPVTIVAHGDGRDGPLRLIHERNRAQMIANMEHRGKESLKRKSFTGGHIAVDLRYTPRTILKSVTKQPTRQDAAAGLAFHDESCG
jgi:hypothetical protein